MLLYVLSIKRGIAVFWKAFDASPSIQAEILPAKSISATFKDRV